MSRRRRAIGLTLALLAAATAGASSARADAAIERKLAVLRALTDPHWRGPLPRLSPDPPDRCAERRAETAHDLRQRAERAVRDAAGFYALDPDLLRAVIRHESAGDPRAVSHKGALGLMQLMPATARELGVECPFDPRENILGGARYLRELRDRLGSWPEALAAYNAGPARVESGRIPGETRRYVRRVLRSWRGGHWSGAL